MSWNAAAIAGCLVLLIFLFWQEIRRPNRARLLPRLITSAVAVISLASMALPLTFSKKLFASFPHTMVLLTEGYQADSVNRFLQRYEQPPPVFVLEGTTGTDPQLRATPIPTDSLRFIWNRYSERHVFGYGFERGSMDLIKGGGFHFHPSAPPAGIQSIHWIRQIKAGEHLVVQGSCNNPLSTQLQICLSGLGATLDSAIIPANSIHTFRLSAVPKLRGKALFSVTVMHHADTLEKEPIPLEVDSTRPARVLVLASTPDFENRFLKDWLAKKGYAITVQTAISRGKKNKLFANTDNQPAERINASSLSKTDVLISDPAALAALGPQEQQTIRAQVTGSGLGLIIRADSLLPRSFYSNAFSVMQTGDSLLKQLSVYTLSAVPDTGSWQAGRPLYIRAQAGNQPLVQTGAANVLASSALVGSGKVVLTTLPNSYSWLLAGNQKMYDAYWSLLLSKALRKQTSTKTWSFSPALPTVDEPVSITLETEDTAPPNDSVAQIQMAYAQNAAMPFAWLSTYWPQPGWQTAGDNIDATNWYSFDAQNWKGIKARERWLITKKYQKPTAQGSEKQVATAALQRVPVPKIYFFIIFIFSAAFLWIEKKFG